jgi:hypothetical protein
MRQSRHIQQNVGMANDFKFDGFKHLLPLVSEMDEAVRMKCEVRKANTG